MKKICIYSIACNEAKNVKRWVQCCQGADLILVGVDGRSNDNTDFMLRGLGVETFKLEIDPWRFDAARNAVLDKIPSDYDICFALDLDDRLRPGWREAIESEWEEDTTLLKYPYIYLWYTDEHIKAGMKSEPIKCYDGIFRMPGLIQPGFKCHARHLYTWQLPIHENLKYIGEQEEKIKFTEKFVLEHHPDLSKPRKYNPLIDLAIKENPNDTWLKQMKARELFSAKDYVNTIEAAQNCLDMSKAYESVEMGQIRSEMCRIIARSKFALNESKQYKLQPGELQLWILRSVNEHPNQRENWVYLGEAWLMYGNFLSAAAAFQNALDITDRNQSPECEARCWDDSYLIKMIQECNNELEKRKPKSMW